MIISILLCKLVTFLLLLSFTRIASGIYTKLSVGFVVFLRLHAINALFLQKKHMSHFNTKTWYIYSLWGFELLAGSFFCLSWDSLLSWRYSFTRFCRHLTRMWIFHICCSWTFWPYKVTHRYMWQSIFKIPSDMNKEITQ